jgi:predicted nuclease of predicted toxin-antitoxin system
MPLVCQLADENFPEAIVDWVRDTGHDVFWARTDCAGLKDSDLLNLAESEARVLVTLDKDFWQIALQRPVPLVRSELNEAGEVWLASLNSAAGTVRISPIFE